MAEIITLTKIRKKVVNVEEESEEIEISEGDYVLIRYKKNPKGSVKSAHFGILKGIGINGFHGGKRVYLHDNGYRLGSSQIYGILKPTIIRSVSDGMSEKSIEKIYVGLENIIKALKSWKGLEGHVGLIKELMERDRDIDVVYERRDCEDK